MKITPDTKVFHLIEEYPESEEVIKKYFSFFYNERIDDIALKRLSIRGAFNVINLPEEERERFFQEINELINKIK